MEGKLLFSTVRERGRAKQRVERGKALLHRIRGPAEGCRGEAMLLQTTGWKDDPLAAFGVGRRDTE